MKSQCYKVLFMLSEYHFSKSSPGAGMTYKVLFSLENFRQFLKYQ